MGKIEKKLNEWKDKGLLSGGQVDAILAYEESLPKKHYAIYTVLTLGVSVLSIGIIALIAANWEDIPKTLKLILDFAILGVLGYRVALGASAPREKITQVLVLGYMLFIMASIGLISQIFNTGGEFYQAMLLWCFITLPIVLIFSSHAIAQIWTMGISIGVFGWIVDWKTSPFKGYDEYVVLSFFPAAYFLLGNFLSLTGEKLKELSFGNFFWSSLSILFSTIILSVESHRTVPEAAQTAFYGGALLSLVSLGVAGLTGFKDNRKAYISTWFIAATYGIFLASSVFTFSSSILNAILFILVWSSFALLALNLNYTKLFEFFIVSIGIRFLVIYFQVLESLVFSAIGLIVSGLLIIAVSYTYLKKREQILNWLSKLA